MKEKTKAIILIIIILGATLGYGIYYMKKTTVSTSQILQETGEPTDQSTEVQDDKSLVEGKVRSMNDKQVYIELADGNGSAINITPTTPVKTEGDENVGNLTSLKAEMNVSVSVNANNDALEILIRK